MSSHASRTLDTPPDRSNRESHINLESIVGNFSSPAPERTKPLYETTKIGSPARPSPVVPRVSAPKFAEFGIPQQIPYASQPKIPGDESRSHFIKHQSPWQTYQRGYDLKLGQYVTVAVRKAPKAGKVAIKEFAKRDVDRKLEMFSRVRHERFVDLLEVFEADQMVYAVFDHIFISLEQVVNSPAFPSERQLAATLGQILEGLSYLSSMELQHGSLMCSNVLLKPDGEIKIGQPTSSVRFEATDKATANQECCRTVDGPPTSDVRAVGYITMELMQKYAKDDGAIGIENLHRWPANSEPVKFLSMTTSAESIGELQQHALLRIPWRKEDLELLAELACFTRRPYLYPA